MQKTKTLLREKNFKAMEVKAFTAPKKEQRVWKQFIFSPLEVTINVL